MVCPTVLKIIQSLKLVDYLHVQAANHGIIITKTEPPSSGLLRGFCRVLIDFLLTVKAAALMFISGRGLAISSAKEEKSGFIYNLVKS